ncbi:cyanophycin synthetase [Candidatus Kaiserbacteria bacterium]|nr:cyanophycin synthetase [Candidatus Kaiserbacteria bacterium]
MKKKEGLILGALLTKLAPRLKAKVLVEPEWGVVGQITYANGKRRYFRYNTLDLNPVGASDVAKDKDYAAFFMRKLGYPVIEGKTFFSREWAKTIGSKRTIDAGFAYAQTLGFPVIVKPNSGSQGTGVALVHTKKDFYSAVRRILRNDKVVLVQRRVAGKDYRIVVLDEKVISAYERTPLQITGDGRATISQLLRKKAREFIAASRDTQLKPDDSRIAAKLKRQKLTMKSVPAKGESIYLLDNANLSTGGDSLDVTDSVHPGFKKLAVALTKDMGLRLCGVDIMTEGDITKPPVKWHILEINAAPGLDHYARSGKAQEKIVEDLYLKVLTSLSR